MKHKNILMALAAMAALPAMAQKPCKVEGQVAKGVESEKVYFYIADANGAVEDDPTDSVSITKGKFKYESNITEPRMVYIQPVMKDGSGQNTCTLFIPGEKLKVTFDGKAFKYEGSDFYKQWGGAETNAMTHTNRLMDFIQEVNKKMEAASEEERKEILPGLQEEYEKLMGERSKAYEDYYEAHKNEAGCALYYMTNIGNVTKYYDMTSDEIKKGKLGSYIEATYAKEKARAEAQAAAQAAAKAAEEKTKAGEMFTDFEAEYNGKIQKLSDYVGKGKYVLVDFWASWCGPCKAEIPNLIEVYNKYKGEQFEVLGVATWDRPKDTEKAIEQMQIPYPQIINAQKAGSDAYGIEGIPQIILFGPDGTIVQRNLRGAAIEEKVKEVLGK